ncbi:MAG: DUF4258 domain-containing protein [Deltaproteobacteria bacterium]|nr:DUF4258 domain-containing protein [Deltaproteobacteria bacterium]
MKVLQRIRQKIIDRDYYLSVHAEEEMVDDNLERSDIEHAVLNGAIEKKLTEDIRGTRYRIAGPAVDERMIYVVCRFKEQGSLLIITAYALEEEI